MKSRTRLIFFVIVFGHLVTEVVAEIPGIPVVHRLWLQQWTAVVVQMSNWFQLCFSFVLLQSAGYF